MRAWLDGDLSGVDPRADLDRLRAVVEEAAGRGEDLAPLLGALAALDPVACAEVVAGPRAPAHPAVVRGALRAVAALEGVIAPAGLYLRLRDLAPEAGPAVLETAGARHPGADWVLRLARGVEAVPGATLLRLHRDAPRAFAACRAVARGGGLDALLAEGVQTGSPLPAAALAREGQLDAALAVAAATLDAHPGAAVLPYLAAAWGPDLLARLPDLLGRLERDEARDWLRRQVDAAPR